MLRCCQSLANVSPSFVHGNVFTSVTPQIQDDPEERFIDALFFAAEAHTAA